MYIPSAPISISGNGTANLALGAQILARNVEMSGNANISLTFDASKLYRPKKPALVE